MVGGIIITMIDCCAWFGRARPSAKLLKKLQFTAAMAISSNLSEEHWPNYAGPGLHPLLGYVPCARFPHLSDRILLSAPAAVP
jgi:hypothetical protein